MIELSTWAVPGGSVLPIGDLCQGACEGSAIEGESGVVQNHLERARIGGALITLSVVGIKQRHDPLRAEDRRDVGILPSPPPNQIT